MKKNILIKIFVFLAVILSIHVCFADNIVIEADKQNFNTKDNMTHFEGNVKAVSNNITVQGPKAVMKIGAENKPEYALFVNNPVATRVTATSKGKLKANIMKLSLLENIVKAEGNAQSFITEGNSPAISMKSDTQELDIATNTITAKGNVVIDYNDLNTKSNEAKIYVDKTGKPREVHLIGAAKVVQGKSIIDADDVIYNPITEEVTATGNTHTVSVMDDLTQIYVWSNVQQYHKSTGSLLASGNVKIAYKEYVAFGPKATFIKEGSSTKPNKVIFLGRSKIREGNREVEANKIEITLNPKDFIAEGNVKTKFTQVQAYKKTTKEKQVNKKAKKDPKKDKAIEEQKFREKFPVIERPVETEPINIFN
jgi:lipopolysaccharide export system protein LptA